MPRIASWGTAEDRPAREAMRSLLIGRHFMAAYREARGGKDEHRLDWWFGWVSEKTAPEFRWMWSSDRAYKPEHTDAYAQVAGDLILKAVAAAAMFSSAWFRTDISEQYGWLFEPSCLEYDGWKRRNLKTNAGKTFESWTNSGGWPAPPEQVIASWGTAEDRPEREAMRALLIGRRFMAAYREAQGGQKKPSRLSEWFDWVRERTAPELQWMWSNHRAYKDEHTDAYAQVAGDLILKAVAADTYSEDWFRPAFYEQWGWLFEDECLEYDGWECVMPADEGDLIFWAKPNKQL